MIQQILSWIWVHLQVNSPRFAGKKTSIIIAGLMALLTVGVLGYLVFRQKDVLQEYSWDINFLSLTKASVIYSLCVLIAAIIWNWIITQFSGNVHRKSHVLTYIITSPAKRLPGSLWYIAGRGLLYKKEEISIKMISIVSGIEHIMILLAGFFISIIFALSTLLDQISPYLLAMIILILSGLIHPKILNAYSVFLMLKLMISGLIISLYGCSRIWVYGFLGGFAYYFLINAFFHTQIDNLIYIISSWTITGFISSLLFLFPSNFGITEISLSLFLGKLMPSSIAVVIVIAGRILYTLLDVVWGLLAMMLETKNSRK